jgi:hypothetical protein
LKGVLLNASVSELEDVINWIERPWAAGKNDALRAAWHEARRSDGAKRALAFAVEEEVRSLGPSARDVAHVAGHLGLSTHTAEAVAAEIARRLGAAPAWSLTVSPEAIASALRATADIARLIVGLTEVGRHGRRHRRYRGGR